LPTQGTRSDAGNDLAGVLPPPFPKESIAVTEREISSLMSWPGWSARGDAAGALCRASRRSRSMSSRALRWGVNEPGESSGPSFGAAHSLAVLWYCPAGGPRGSTLWTN
jgi:hypothetical protein